MADFVVVLTLELKPKQEIWILHVDDSSNTRGSRVGVVLEGLRELLIKQFLRFHFKTNNQAKYEVLIASLTLT